jgi:hypothetical protein
MTLAIYGFHFRKITEKYISTPIGNILGLRATEKTGE